MKPISLSDFLRSELKSTQTFIVIAVIVFALLLGWQSYTTFQLHKNYQNTLMAASGKQIIGEYQNTLSQLREKIDSFQHQYQLQLHSLVDEGEASVVGDYMALLKLFRSELDDVRLFSVIDDSGAGLFTHITGEFLPDCQNEIDTTLLANNQEQLFLHRSASSVHYDILQPLIKDDNSYFLFVAFNADKMKRILEQFRLPHQELFLLRNDLKGKVEISVTGDDETLISMHDAPDVSFSYLEPIPGTRWSVAIRLSDSYDAQLLKEIVNKAILIWLFLTMILIWGYHIKRKRILAEFSIKRQLEYSEAHDGLTGLLNLKTWLATFEQEQVTLEAGIGAAFVIDLDKFQMFNNAMGFSKGDEYLRLLTQHLQSLLTSDIHFARIGSDQFGIIHPKLPHQELELFADFIKRNIEEFEVTTEAEPMTLTAGIGALKLNSEIIDEQHLMDALLLALKLAKAKGMNQVQSYQSDDPLLQSHANEMAILKSLKQALIDNDFELHLQKIQNARDENEKLFEVLVRMKHKDGGLIPPNAFIPVAEAHGLAIKLDQWVIDNAMCKLREEENTMQISINLSGATLDERSMTAFVIEKLQSYSINPKRIVFEITETFAITHIESATAFIQELSDIGCEFALDDFGSGLSSFSYLQTLPVKKLKIDGAFVRDIANNKRNQEFIKAMVRLAESLNMDTVAEFVETGEDVAILKRLNIDYLQGYYYSIPSKWN